VKVLIVVAQRYNGHELWTTLGILQEAGIDFEVISTMTNIADEVTGQPNTIVRTIDDVDVAEIADFNGLAVVSGNMADTELYWDHEKVLAYVEEAKRLNLVIAAICCSVPTIRGAADGKTVSYYPLIRSAARLADAGAILSNITISVDGKLVTAEHQMASQGWAEAFVKVLKGEEVELGLSESGFTPQGRTERSLHPTLERIRGTDTSYRDRKRDGTT
jgi:putative intracellular protease/amidase